MQGLFFFPELSSKNNTPLLNPFRKQQYLAKWEVVSQVFLVNSLNINMG